MKNQANADNVPYLFAQGRRLIGYQTFRSAPVSVMAILNYEGLEVIKYNEKFQLIYKKKFRLISKRRWMNTKKLGMSFWPKSNL